MRIVQLGDLPNIINEIDPKDEEPLFNEKFALQFIETIFFLLDEYITENPKAVSEPDFYDECKDIIQELIIIPWEQEINLFEDIEEELDIFIDEAIELYFNSFFTSRSFQTTFTNALSYEYCKLIEEKLIYLRNKPQPVQRTQAWYEFRHKLITASNAYKAFESQSVKNQLIYEKCQPLKEIKEDVPVSMVNVNTTLHWGQKYEPLSVLIYEHLYNTKIEDFGCIRHDTYSFLGASPDGINVDPQSERYGRMLEIKNIVNREITGIPKKEYWIQMQLQMEVWDLDECDFLETKFIEYENEQQYLLDNVDYYKKGIIMYFATSEGNPFYIYKPITIIEQEDINAWEENMMETTSLTWIKNCYWKLEKMSCVLVLRNKEWFATNIQELQDIWNIILKERETGFQHRAPNKRIKKDVDKEKENDQNSIQGCLLQLDKDNKIHIHIQEKPKHNFFGI